MAKRILITCPNLINTINEFSHKLSAMNFNYDIPKLSQRMEEEDLLKIIGNYDGWIAGDDPATRKVLEEGKKGKLKALVKWGVGTDNIDKKACEDLKIKFSNTPRMFGNDVADSALCYLLMACRENHRIDTKVRDGEWYKPLGVRLSGKKALVVGYGDIGQNIGKRLLAFGVQLYVKDPFYTPENFASNIVVNDFSQLPEYDFVILSCPLVDDTYHLVTDWFFKAMKNDGILINVSRGQLVDTNALLNALQEREIGWYASDVFEDEPLPPGHPLLFFNNVIVGSHNGSNTKDGVFNTNMLALDLIDSFL